jgi:hypothetical protein
LVSDIKGEHGVRVFKNRVLRWIFGPKRDEVMMGEGVWKKLQTEKLHQVQLE